MSGVLSALVDKEGFRPNVGIIICNREGKVFWAKRVGQQAWQFPQGGIDAGESPLVAMYRELYEEVGLERSDVVLLAETKGWLRYRLPRRLVRKGSNPRCIGQKQKWFLLELLAEEERIRFDRADKPEFDDWAWVSYWYPVNQVIDFKRDVYRKALKEVSLCHSELERKGTV